MKQWMKYSMVIMSFVIMAGYFLGYPMVDVNASDVATVSENAVSVFSEGGNEAEGADSMTGVESNAGETEAENGTEIIAEGTNESWNVTIKYDINDSSGSFNEIQYTPELLSGAYTIYISEEIPIYSGHRFVGWSSSNEGAYIQPGQEMVFVAGTASGQVVTLTAKWEELPKVTIAYVGENESIETATIQQNAETDETFNLTVTEHVPTKAYFKFKEWVCGIDNLPYEMGSVIENLSWKTYAGQMITFTAEWEELPSVTLEYIRYDGKTITDSVRQVSESEENFSVELPIDDSEYSSYKFAGWLHTDESTNEGTVYPVDGEAPTFSWKTYAGQTITFTARWEKLPDVTINFENLDGSVDKSSIQQLNIEETEFSVTIPENKSKKEGYRFTGWLCQEDGKVYAVGEAATFSWETFGNKTIAFTTEWEELPKVTIEYQDENGIFETASIRQLSETQKAFDLSVTDKIPTRAYYRFSGWLSDTDNQEYESASVISGLSWEAYGGKTITLTAQWEELPKITISYVVENESIETVTIQQKAESDETFNLTLTDNVPEKPYYKFKEWVCGIDNLPYESGSIIENLSWKTYVGQTIIFTADWEELPKVTIEYQDENGIFETASIRQLSETEKTFDLTVTDKIPTRTYYRFSSWLSDTDNQGYESASVISGLSWETYGGKTITLTAQWEELPKITISYVVENESIETVTIQQEAESDETFNLTLTDNVPAKPYYKFKEWICDIDNLSYGLGSVIENLSWKTYAGRTITFTAEWEELPKVTIEYQDENGIFETASIRQLSESEKTFDLTVTDKIPTRTYYRFSSWLSDTDNQGYESASVISGLSWEAYGGKTITLTAQWEELPKIMISYVVENESVETATIQQEAESDETFNLTLTDNVPTKPYYKFKEWVCDIDNMPYESGTIMEGLNWKTYADQTITFTEQWEELPKVTIEYQDENGIFETASIRQLSETEKTFDLTVTDKIPTRTYYRFSSWLSDTDNQGYESASVISGLSWEIYGGKTITMTAQWTWDEYHISGEGEYLLSVGEPYCLGEGTWTVTGDDYSYAGGSIFYVEQDETYTFSVE